MAIKMNDKKSYPLSKRNLDKYDVFIEDNYESPRFFDVRIEDNILYYGKNYASIATIDNEESPYTLKLSSYIQIEVKDSNDNIIFHELVYNVSYSYFASFYIWIEDDLFNTYESLLDGHDNVTVTILGELTDNNEKIPDKWVGIYNVRMTIPLSVRENKKNTSPLYFNKDPKFEVDEETHYDDDNFLYNRSFARIIIDNLHTIGGIPEYGEISYISNKSNSKQKQILNTFEIERSGSGTETLRQKISNVGIDGIDDTYSTGIGSGSLPIGNFPAVGLPHGSRNWRLQSKTSPSVNYYTQSFIPQYGTVYASTAMSKVFRYAYEDEEYEISYKISGSGNVRIKESSFQSHLTGSPKLDNLTSKTIYNQQFTNIDLEDNSTWKDNYDSHGLSRNNIVSGSSTYITGSFIISSASYAVIYLDTYDSTDTCSFAEISIIPNHSRGYSPPFYYHKVQVPPLSRRDETYKFNLKIMNPDMELARKASDNENILITGSSYFSGSSITFEKPDTIFIASQSIDGSDHLKQAFAIASPNITNRSIDDPNDMMGVFYDTTNKGLVFGKDDVSKSGTFFNQSGSNSFVIISGSVRDTTYLQVKSGSNVTTIYPNAIESETYIVSSSLMYITQSAYSGSTIFGDTSDDTHTFTGSMYIESGSFMLYGTASSFISMSNGAYLGNIGTTDATTNKIVGSTTYGNSIFGGLSNVITGSDIFSRNIIIGGSSNHMTMSQESVINTGHANLISNHTRCFIGGGSLNLITSSQGTCERNVIVGGSQNNIFNDHSFGQSYCVIVGGTQNKIENGLNNFIGGGRENHMRFAGAATAGVAVIGGGYQNKIWLVDTYGQYGPATIAGGYANEITGSTSSDWIFGGFIGGGNSNKIYSEDNLVYGPVIVGGRENKILDSGDSSILGGYINSIINSDESAILGGKSNLVQSGHNNVFILGSSITSSQSDTTYTENIIANGNISGSTTGSFDYIVSNTDISASGNLYADGITTTGNTILGNHGNDVHQVSGSLSVLSDITTATDFYGTIATPSQPNITALGTLTEVRTSGNITASGNLEVGGHITASGYISTPNSITASNDITASGDLYATRLYSSVLQASNIQITTAGIEVSPTSDVTITGDLKVTSHISASGDISGSSGYHGAIIHTTGSLGNGEANGGDIVRYLAINGDHQGKVVYNTGGDWRPADKDDEGKVANMLGVALGNDGTKDVLVRGFVRLASGGIADAGGNEGDPLYLSDDGTVKFAPSTTGGHFNKVIGFCINESEDLIWFDPDKTWVEVA